MEQVGKPSIVARAYKNYKTLEKQIDRQTNTRTTTGIMGSPTSKRKIKTDDAIVKIRDMINIVHEVIREGR